MSKIVILSPAHPLRGGIASSSERLAQALQADGHEVLIVSFSLQYPSILFPGKTQYTDDAAPAGLQIDTRINAINPLNWWRTGRYVARLTPDIIVARFWLPFMGPSLGTILRIAKRRCHAHTIALADNILPHEKRPGDRLLTRYFVRSVDSFIVMSKAVGEDVRRFTPTKPVCYVPHPIYDNYGPMASRSEALQHLALSPAHRYLLFFGFIRDYKGLDLLLQAFAHPDVLACNVRLIVAGEFYSDRQRYDDLVRELQLQEHVLFYPDFIPHDEVRYYFAAADLITQTYKTATQSGISQLAYHFEKPILVTDVGGLAEIVPHGEAGYVVPVSVPAITQALLDFFQNNRQEPMTAQVRQHKKRFDWSTMVKAIKDLAAPPPKS